MSVISNPSSVLCLTDISARCSAKISFCKKLEVYANLSGNVDPFSGGDSMKLGISVFLDVGCFGTIETGARAAQSAAMFKLSLEQNRHHVDMVVLVSEQHLQQQCTGSEGSICELVVD